MESTGGGTSCGDDEGEVGGGSGRVAAAAGTSRWNPTKEQIRILEEMYKQGIRTPTAEQIQQITGRLKEYGHIEGKNVFYWFQNHKARQRQKEKQESLALLSRYFHHRYRSAFPSPCPNVICGPYCMPPNELGLYPIHPKILLPCGVKRRQRSDFIEESEARRGEVHNSSSHPNDNCYDSVKRLEINALNAACDTNRRTLDLFPLHPTGIEDGNTKEVSAAAPTSSLEVQEAGSNDQRHQDYFDFFSSGDDDGCCG